MQTDESNQIFSSLKKVLKTKGITYASLAKELQMAESSVKRIFANENCSLDKLVDICSVLEISLSQLTDLYSAGSLPELEIHPEAESFFLRNPHYFSFLRQLSLNNSVKEVQSKNKLSSSSTKKYLIKLEELNLVKRVKKNEYEIVRSGFIKLSENGELLAKLTEQWSKNLLEKSLKKEKDYLMHIASTRLKNESIDHFKSEIKNLVKRLKNQGHLENLVSSDNVNPFGICLISGPEIINFPTPIPNI